MKLISQITRKEIETTLKKNTVEYKWINLQDQKKS